MHRYHITINIISICRDTKMHTNSTCYLNLAAVVEPLDVVRMWMWSCGERKLLHHLHASQVVAAPSVYDDAHRTFLHNSLGMEQIVPLILLSLCDLHTQNTLSN